MGAEPLGDDLEFAGRRVKARPAVRTQRPGPVFMVLHGRHGKRDPGRVGPQRFQVDPAAGQRRAHHLLLALGPALSIAQMAGKFGKDQVIAPRLAQRRDRRPAPLQVAVVNHVRLGLKQRRRREQDVGIGGVGRGKAVDDDQEVEGGEGAPPAVGIGPGGEQRRTADDQRPNRVWLALQNRLWEEGGVGLPAHGVVQGIFGAADGRPRARRGLGKRAPQLQAVGHLE